MAEARFVFTISGAFGRALKRLDMFLRHPRAFMAGMGSILTQGMETYQFRRGGSPSFHPLERRYRARKVRRYGPQPILTASGAMRRGLTFATKGERTVGVYSSRTVGKSHLNLLMLHHRGTSKMPRRSPAQRIMRATIQRIGELLSKFLHKIIQGV